MLTHAHFVSWVGLVQVSVYYKFTEVFTVLTVKGKDRAQSVCSVALAGRVPG